jgi:hypothetical protein
MTRSEPEDVIVPSKYADHESQANRGDSRKDLIGILLDERFSDFREDFSLGWRLAIRLLLGH